MADEDNEKQEAEREEKPATLEELENNLESLKIQLNLWRILTIILFVIMAVFIMRIKSERQIILKDNEGNERIFLGVFPDGSTGFAMVDRNKRMKLGMGITPDGNPNINLMDHNEVIRISLKVLPDGTPQIMALDNKRSMMPSPVRTAVPQAMPSDKKTPSPGITRPEVTPKVEPDHK